MATSARWLRCATLALIAAACMSQETETPQGEGQEEVDEEGKTRREKAAQYSYCEEDNCYDILGVKKTSGQIAIKRAYRRLASEWHPDKNPDPRAKEQFQRYARAYQVLSDAEMRTNYDYVLDHPMEFPMFYLRYGSGTYQPKSDVRVVLVLVILGVSATQFLYQKQRRLNVLQGVKSQRTYTERVKTLTAEYVAGGKGKAARPSSGSSKSKKDAAKGKADGDAEAKKMAEAKVLEEIEENLPDEANYKDTLAFAIFTLPLTSCYTMYSTTNWIVQFKILGKEYGPEEKDYLTRKALGYTKAEWKRIPDEEKESLAEQELWIAENKEAYEEEQQASSKSPTRSNKEKRAIRQRKKPSDAPPMMDD